MADKEFNDLRHEFTGKVGDVGAYSREFLLKLVQVYEDTWLFSFHAWATAYGNKIGDMEEAWDIAGEISRGIGRQVMPIGPHVATVGSIWKESGIVAEPFDCEFNDLSKEGLVKLCKTHVDRWLKMGNVWLDAILNAKKLEMEGALEVLKDAYGMIGGYEIPKIAKAGDLEIKTVVDNIKVANLCLDATTGYGGTYEVINPDHVLLKMTKCDVLDKYREEGVYGDDMERIYNFNCKYEAEVSMNVSFPYAHIDVKLPPKDFNFAEGEPYCVWTYTKKA